MSAVSIRQMADRVAELMELRLKAKGKGLAEKLKRSGRGLPRGVRKAAESLSVAAEQAGNPRLLQQLDMAKVAADYDACLRYLGDLGAGARRMGLLLDWLARLAFIALVVGGLLVAVLYWRGYLGQ